MLRIFRIDKCLAKTSNRILLNGRFGSFNRSLVRFVSTKPNIVTKNDGKRYSGSTVALYFTLGLFLGTSIITYKLAKNPPEFLFPHSSTTKLAEISSPRYGDPDKVVKELKNVLSADQIRSTKETLETHSDSSFSTHHATPDQRPVAVIFPNSTEEVSLVLKACHKYKVPVVPYTGGTSLEGHYTPTRKGISVDLSRMNKVLAVHAEDLDVTVQAAVGWQTLANYLKSYNLMFGPDPGPGACIGGMVGTSCSGTNAARWGTMKENVVSLTVVLADGTIIKTKNRPRKSAAGYNLNGLFIGSEGTLGIVTEATLKLNVKPKYENVAVISFPTISDASSTVAQFVQHGIQLDAMELLDDKMMKYVNVSGQTTLKYDEAPTLMLKIGGTTKEAVKSQINDVKRISKENHQNSFRFASSDAEREELWNARKVALWSTINYGQEYIDKDIQVWATDVAVPISKLCECLTTTKNEMNETGVAGAIVGHVGDGNYHAMILFKREDRPKVERIVRHMVDGALKAEGTVTGEHGVGMGKRGFLKQELPPDAIDLMRKIKFALDPYRILNPDKVFSIDPKDKGE